MAFRFLNGPEIRNDFGRLHDDLAEKQRAGTDDLGCHPHEAHQCMHLGKVPARCPKLFPDIRHCVQTDHIYPFVAQKQHIVRHVIEDGRIPVIQVPLVRIECGHDDLLQLAAPAEIAGSRLREHLRNRLLEFVRNVPVIEKVIPVLVLLLSFPRLNRPFVIFAGMVHDKVQTDAHIPLMAGIRQGFKILHGSKGGFYTSEIRNRVSAVTAPRRALEQRHQVKIVYPALLNIVQVLLNSLQIAGKALRIHEHANQFIFAVPVRSLFSDLIKSLQLLLSLRIIPKEHGEEIVKRSFMTIVQL